jgi:hypothetical protein
LCAQLLDVHGGNHLIAVFISNVVDFDLISSRFIG